jgi:hypothetical protein
MLTPAEELGLAGLNLSSRVRLAFFQVPPARMVELLHRLRDEALRRQLIYLRDGRPEPVRVLPCPLTILPDQHAYLHSVSLTVHNALKRLPDLYLQDPDVRDILRLTDGEERWLRDCWGPGLRENNPVFGRLDALIDYTSPMWKESLQFVEPNLSGIGGLHLVPTAERIVADVIVPVLEERDPQLRLQLGQDIRELLMQEVVDHLDAVGRKAQNVCFVEPKYAGSGPEEQEALARYYHDRYGTRIMHADPAELSLRDGEVYYDGLCVDLAYRDYSVLDLIEIEREGTDVEPMRQLFLQNRMVSSIGAELDQKACWEVLTDALLAERHFSADERQVFRRHILWTRVLSDRKTTLPDGSRGSLLDFVRNEHERLVLKPNRNYGGEGVKIGLSLSQAEWESAMEAALRDTEDRWVVQRLASIPVWEFPVLGPRGQLYIEPFYVVMGFAPSKYGLAILGRGSQKQVVNVAQRGGMCAVFIGQSPGRLLGPEG